MRIGHGYDVHRLVEGRRLVLGGVEIPYEKGLLGHSDADVLTHAIMDAILGALALGDIGGHFPDTDPAYQNADSMVLLSHCVALMEERDMALGNLDATIIAQKPKLATYLPQMREKLAAALHTDIARINLKATTEEGLGFTGTGEGMGAHCVLVVEIKDANQGLKNRFLAI
jgi:2-C-methyl-D-erythritol 2,4-cyclodiphosphate synthase